MTLNLALNEFGAHKPVRSDVFDVFAQYAAQKPYSLAKAFYVLGVDVPKELGLMSKDNVTWTKAAEQAKLFKLTRAPFDLLKGMNTLYRSTWSWYKGKEFARGEGFKTKSKVTKDTLGLVNPVWEICDFFTKAILFIPKQSIQTLKGVNGGTLVILKGWDTIDHLKVLSTKDLAVKSPKKVEERLLKLITDVAYLAIGILSTLMVFTTMTFASFTMTMLSATTVVFSILSFYHKNHGEVKKLT